MIDPISALGIYFGCVSVLALVTFGPGTSLTRRSQVAMAPSPAPEGGGGGAPEGKAAVAEPQVEESRV